ncbi:MAG: hypothetical protein ACRD50_12410 [Candidatus Acidiferrales bacterium]
MNAKAMHNPVVAAANCFTARDIASILREREWWQGREASTEIAAWMDRAAALLGQFAADRATLAGLLALIFEYDARRTLARTESHAVLSRMGAREVIRDLGNRILETPELDSENFKRIIEEMKMAMKWRGRELFQPIRLALAGRAGEGELDRVILVAEEAARLPFSVRVKGARERMIEFCAAVD